MRTRTPTHRRAALLLLATLLLLPVIADAQLPGSWKGGRQKTVTTDFDSTYLGPASASGYVIEVRHLGAADTLLIALNNMTGDSLLVGLLPGETWRTPFGVNARWLKAKASANTIKARITWFFPR